jgi:hypothetical protein
VLAHDLRTDPLALEVSVDGEGTEMDVRHIRVVLGPGRDPLPDPSGRPRAEAQHAGEQPQALPRLRLAGPRRGDPRHGDDPSLPHGADWLLRREDSEQRPHHAGVAGEPPLRILPVGGDVQRVVSHPPGEHTDGVLDLIRAQIAHLH